MFDVDFDVIILKMLSYIIPKPIHMLILEASQHRLGKKINNFDDFFEALYEKDLTISEMMSIPENDDWKYSTGYARVCSSFVMDVYHKSGMF